MGRLQDVLRAVGGEGGLHEDASDLFKLEVMRNETWLAIIICVGGVIILVVIIASCRIPRQLFFRWETFLNIYRQICQNRAEGSIFFTQAVVLLRHVVRFWVQELINHIVYLIEASWNSFLSPFVFTIAYIKY